MPDPAVESNVSPDKGLRRESGVTIRSDDGTPRGHIQKDARQLEIEEAAKREAIMAHRNNAYVVQYLEKRTYFDTEQIKVLQKMYKRFKGTGSAKSPTQMDRLCFRDMIANLFGITDNLMLDRIFQAFDRDHEGSVSEVEWIIGLSVQLRGSLDQQIAYAYDVYDVNSDRSLGRDEITSFLRHSLYTIPGVLESDELDDGMNELVDLALRKFDINKDGGIQFDEFRHVLRKEPYLSEVFGEVLPHDRAVLPVMALLDANPRSFKRYLSSPGDSAFVQDREHYDSFAKPDIYDPLTFQRHKEHDYHDFVHSDATPVWTDGTVVKNTPNKSTTATGRKGSTKKAKPRQNFRTK